MITVTKKDLIALGYGPSFSADIIKQAKNLMIERGHTYYQSRKLDQGYPKNAVEEILGINCQTNKINSTSCIIVAKGGILMAKDPIKKQTMELIISGQIWVMML